MHKLLEDSPGKEMLLLGNEAIARGAIEAGIGVASCYPGTPSSEIPDTFFALYKEAGFYFEYSTNEKVALEVAAGAAVSGVRSIVTMKHVGMNVASDALMTMAYLGVNAGMVVINADDPFLFSSQNEQDNRYYARLSGLPMIEPQLVQQIVHAPVPKPTDLVEQVPQTFGRGLCRHSSFSLLRRPAVSLAGQ